MILQGRNGGANTRGRASWEQSLIKTLTEHAQSEVGSWTGHRDDDTTGRRRLPPLPTLAALLATTVRRLEHQRLDKEKSFESHMWSTPSYSLRCSAAR